MDDDLDRYQEDEQDDEEVEKILIGRLSIRKSSVSLNSLRALLPRWAIALAASRATAMHRRFPQRS